MKTVYTSLTILALGLTAIPASAGPEGSAGGCCANGAATKTTTAATCPGAAGGVTASLASASSMHDMDMDVSAAIEHSGAIAAILAADGTKGLAEHANGMATVLGLDKKEHAGHDMPAGGDAPHAVIAAQLAVLGEESVSISDAREAFLTLQEAFIPVAEAAYTRQDGDPEWAVYYCGMVKGSWIQPSGDVENPFYGSKMQRCGKKVMDLGKTTDEAAEGHGEHGAH